MGNSFSIGGNKFDRTNMPSDFQIQDVKSKKMQRTLNLFDVNGDGVISKDEADRISLFYKTGSATFSRTEGGQTIDYTISAKKPGKNPIETKTEIIDQNDNLVYSETTQFNRRVEEQRTDQYRYKHNSDGSVDETHDVIDSNDNLVKTEESVISDQGVHTPKRTITYSNGSTPGEVEATYKNNDGSTFTDRYWSF